MSPKSERSQVFSALAEAVCSDPAVTFAVVFGSRISGDSTLSSDIDLAIKFAGGLSDRDRFEKRCFLSGDLQHDDRPFVDVSDIESLPLDVAHDAVTGEFLCGDKQAFDQFKRDIRAEFDRQRETRRRQQRAVIDRIAEDGLRG